MYIFFYMYVTKNWNENLFLIFSPPYKTLPAQAQLGNVLGLLLVILAGTVLFVVTNAAFRRVDPEEERVSLINDKE